MRRRTIAELVLAQARQEVVSVRDDIGPGGAGLAAHLDAALHELDVASELLAARPVQRLRDGW